MTGVAGSLVATLQHHRQIDQTLHQTGELAERNEPGCLSAPIRKCSMYYHNVLVSSIPSREKSEMELRAGRMPECSPGCVCSQPILHGRGDTAYAQARDGTTLSPGTITYYNPPAWIWVMTPKYHQTSGSMWCRRAFHYCTRKSPSCVFRARRIG
jgi:hypothetical protein